MLGLGVITLYDNGFSPFARKVWLALTWKDIAHDVVDGLLINVSYWRWAKRDDAMPDGLLDAARRDLDPVYAALERDLADRAFVSGDTLSIADVALFPHLTATGSFGLGHDPARFPCLHDW